MKNIKWLSGAFIMALGLLVFGACANDDEKANPVFPEKQAIDCAAGEVKTLTFHAENAWTLASSRLWCKFKDGNEIVSSLSGGPGKQTVTITVNGEIWGFEDAIADIIMGTEGQVQVIAAVNRAAQGYRIEAYRMNGQDKEHYDVSNPLILPYTGIMNVEVNANFDWKIKNCPEWINVDETLLLGEAGKTISWDIKFKVSATYPSAKEQRIDLQFEDVNGAVRLNVPVVYGGIPEDKIEFIPNSPWNTIFSADGKEYWQASGTTGDAVHYLAPRVVTTASKDGFKLVYLKNDQWGYTPCGDWEIANLWFSAEILDNQIKISVKPNEDAKERKGCLLAIPMKVAENLDIYDIITSDEPSDIKSQYFQYVVADFTQEKAQSAGGFTVSYNGQTLQTTYQGGNLDFVNAYHTTNIYSLELTSAAQSQWLSITPIDYPFNYCMFALGANMWGIDPSNFETERKTLNMLVPNAEGGVDILFMDADGNNIAVLMVSLWY